MCVWYRSFEPTHLLWESELSSERYARTGQLQDEEDIEKSFDIFFKLINWDPATGAPTEQAYKDINLEFVIPVMQKEGLIPGK